MTCWSVCCQAVAQMTVYVDWTLWCAVVFVARQWHKWLYMWTEHYDVMKCLLPDSGTSDCICWLSIMTSCTLVPWLGCGYVYGLSKQLYIFEDPSHRISGSYIKVLRIGPSVGLLWTRWWILGAHKRRGVFWPGERFSSSREELCSVVVVVKSLRLESWRHES
jgi:hypothetical protein